MKQIRVAWKRGTHAAREVGLVPTDGAAWVPDDAEHREDVAALVASGNEVCGAGTHWLEERDSADESA